MAAQSEDLISSFINEAAVKKQADNFIAQLNSIYDLYTKINNTKITLSSTSGISDITKNASTLNTQLNSLGTSVNNIQQSFVKLGPGIAGADGLIKQINDRIPTMGEAMAGLKVVLQENSAAMDVLKKAYEGGEISIDQFVKAQGQLIVREKELKAQQSELNIQLNAYGKSVVAVAGSSDEASNRLGRLRDIYRQLTDDEKSQPFGQNLKNSIDQLDPALKAADASIGNFQRNVGDYANAFGSGFGVLKDEISKVQEQINSGGFGGEELEKLKEQEDVLSEVTQQLSREFATTEAQTRAFKNAAAEIGLAFGTDSKIFTDFKNKVGESALALNEIKKSIKLASSETPGLDKLIHAATGIAGAFAIAEGAAALFGEENEDLQKTFVKLQAAMTILNGLQHVANELKNQDSILRKAINFLTGAQIKLTNQQTVAQEANTVATQAATTATVTFGAALKALSIAGLLLLIPLLVSAFDKFSNSSNVVNKYLGEGVGKSKALNDSLKELGKTTNEIADGAIANLKEEIKKMNGEIGNVPTAIEQARAALQILDSQLEELNNKNIFDKIFNYGKYTQFGNAIVQQKKNLQEQIDQYNKTLGLKSADDDLKNTTELFRTQTTLQANLVINANEAILSNTKSTNAQKIAALKSSYEQQNVIIQQQLNAELETTGDPTRRKIAEEKANAARILNQRNLNSKIEGLNSTSNNNIIKDNSRVVDAEFELQQTILSHVSDFLKERAADESYDYDIRLAALKAYYDKQEQLAQLELQHSLSKSGLLPAEREKIELEAQYKLESLRKQFAAETVALTQAQADKESKAIEDANAKKLQAEKEFQQAKVDLANDELNSLESAGKFIDTVYATQYAKDEAALYSSYQTKKLSQSEYQKQSLALQVDFQKKQLQNDINIADRSLHVSNISYDKKAELEKKLAELKLKLAQLTGEAVDAVTESSIETLKKQLQTIGGIFSNLGSIISDIAGIGFDKQNAELQAQLDLLDEKRQKDVEIANATIQNEQDKAAAILTINARTDAQQKVLDDKKRQLQQRQAAYDKASTVSEIITRTSLAVVTTLADKTILPGWLRIPLAITVGAMGLAQLARAIASPLPQFKHGKTNSYEGPAIVGDGGQQEVIERNGSIELTPATPTVTYLRKEDKVYSSINKYMEYAVRPRFKYLATTTERHDPMHDFMGLMNKRLTSVEMAIRNKKETHFTVTPYGLMAMQKDMANKINYINDNLQF